MKATMFLFACLLPAALVANVRTATLTLDPSPARSIRDCPVSVRTEQLPQFSEADYEQLAVFHNGEEISSQRDDTDGDGKIDEIAFLIDLHENTPCVVEIRPVERHKEFPREVNAQMWLKGPAGGEFKQHTAEGKSYGIKSVTEQTFYTSEDSFHKMHHHGVAFESALMAYRIYFDKRQTIDVYAKKTPRRELEACLWYPNDEQLAAGFGDDVLKVGNTIGVGSVRPWNGNKLTNIDKYSKRTQRIVATGNIRTICETETTDWQTEGKTVTMIVRYTLYARHRDVLCEVFVSEPLQQLATGVQRVGTGHFHTAHNLSGSWGTDWPVNDTVKYAKETIGLGVYVPEEYIQDHAEDARNNLIVLRPATYLRFFLTVVSQKENNPPAGNEEEFIAYLHTFRREADTYLQPAETSNPIADSANTDNI